MKKRSVWFRGVLAGLAASAFLLTHGARNVAWAAGNHAFTGESKCEDCHDAKHEALKDIIGPNGQPGANPVDVWNQDKHHDAFNNLTNDWGKQAAAKANVSDPQADGSMCLKCHATGVGGNNPPDPSEGVSCEACHGPAADWVPKDKHGEIGNDASKMAAAVALGLIDVRKMDVRQANCQTCHVKDVSLRPCYRPSEKPFDVRNDSKFRHWRNNIPAI